MIFIKIMTEVSIGQEGCPDHMIFIKITAEMSVGW